MTSEEKQKWRNRGEDCFFALILLIIPFAIGVVSAIYADDDYKLQAASGSVFLYFTMMLILSVVVQMASSFRRQ